MSHSDIKQIAAWAIVTAVLVGGLLTSGAAISNDPAPAQPELSANVEGVNFVAVAQPAAEPDQVKLTIKAENPAPKAKKVDVAVALVRKDFVGNPLSRTISPTDYKETVEREQILHFVPKPNDTSIKTLTMPLASQPAAKKPDQPMRVATYELRVKTDNEKPKTIAYFPANVSQPKK